MSALLYCSHSEKGLRDRNDDACLAREANGIYLFAIAEGMGGPMAGASAAEVAISALSEGATGKMESLPDVVESCLVRADSALFSLQQANPESEPPAVAMTLAVVRPGGECVVSSSGYRKLFFLAQPQSGIEGGDLIENTGNEGLHDPGAGMHEALLPPGFLILCSDGISDFVDNERIFGIISERGDDLEDACRKMVYEAFQNGSDDNMTVVLVRQPRA